MRDLVRNRLVPAAVLATALAGAIAAGTAPKAYAASGSFTYTGGDGTTKTSGAPPSGQCLHVVGSGPVRNTTDRSVALYRTSDCQPDGRITQVGPMRADTSVSTFQSAFWSK